MMTFLGTTLGIVVWTVIIILATLFGTYKIACNNPKIRTWLIARLNECACKAGKCS